MSVACLQGSHYVVVAGELTMDNCLYNVDYIYKLVNECIEYSGRASDIEKFKHIDLLQDSRANITVSSITTIEV